MTNSQIPAINLILFAAKLREGGLKISAQEVGDAARILGMTGLESRETVRNALKSLFSKSRREGLFFNETFNEFFVSERKMSQRREEEIAARDYRLRQIRDAREELSGADVPEEIAEAYSGADDKRKRWLRDMMKRVNEKPHQMPLFEFYLRSIATGWLTGEGATGVEAPDSEDDLLYKSLASITEAEVPHALALIDTLVRRINGADSRKWKRAGRNGLPDMRATIHGSLRTGGVPVNPRYRKRPRSARHIIVLCDVSESMYRFSGFALRFITALGSLSNRTSAFIFSEGFEQIWLHDLENFENTVKASGLWRRGTDAGAALQGLQSLSPSPLAQDVILIILSDAKTVRAGYAAKELEAVAKTVRRIVWLNPETRGKKAAELFSEYCDMLACGTLRELSEAISTVIS